MKVSENLQTRYDAQYEAGVSAWRMVCAKQKVQNILEVCRDLPRAGRVLDVGAGDGSILALLDEAGFCDSLYAIDISRSSVDEIGKRGIASLKEVQQYDGYRIPYDDEFFDLVILSHVIEHVEFPRALLREIRRVSRHQVIEIPLDFIYDVDRKVDHFLAYGHINVYHPMLFRFLLRTEGFVPLADRVSINEMEVFFHSTFVMAGKRKTAVAVVVAAVKVFLRRMAVRWLGRNVAELVGHAYTVLCAKEAA
ncbi:hypothetical protein GMSM_26210 [Geomonas sp. Red276]